MRLLKFAALSVLGALAFVATPANAQATRTWVSGVGNDADPCSRTAPCKTFAGAIIKTATGGEINCLDPGGFGAVTINKSLSIVCDYTEGGGLVAGAGLSGVIVNATSTSVVFLSGIDFNGVGTASNGIRVLVAASVTVQNSTIRNFNASSGVGISFQPSGSTELVLNNVTIENNGTGATGGGILIQPTGALGTGKVTLNNTRVINNANHGVFVNTTSNTAGTGITVTLNDSLVTGNGQHGVNILQPAGTQSVGMMINGATINSNVGTGLVAAGAGTIVRVDDTTINGNAGGLSSSSGASILSYGGNRVDGNPTTGAAADGAFTGPVLRK